MKILGHSSTWIEFFPFQVEVEARNLRVLYVSNNYLIKGNKKLPLKGDYPSLDKLFMMVRSLSLNDYLIDFLFISFYLGVTMKIKYKIWVRSYSKDFDIFNPLDSLLFDILILKLIFYSNTYTYWLTDKILS